MLTPDDSTRYYLTDNDYVDQRPKGTKKCLIKREIKFESCKNYLDNNETILNL